MPSLEKNLSKFEELNTQVLGITVDSKFVLKAWADQAGGAHYPLLSDLKKEVSEKYGVLRKDGFSERGTFFIDKEGVVRWKKIQPSLQDERTVEDLLQVAASLCKS